MAAPVRAAEPADKAGKLKVVKKGEFLFSEGDTSTSCYLVRLGQFRVFKRRGDSCIEIDTIRQGQVIGELAFLDGLPRSASAQALCDGAVIEISGEVFAKTLSSMPDWLKVLLKTVVGRLRTASNRLRQMESASVAYNYGKEGSKSSQYVYLGTSDVLRICAGLLLVSSRAAQSGTATPASPAQLHKYANQIMGVPVAKITSFLDLLAEVGAVETGAAHAELIVKDVEFIEKAVNYINEQNLVEPEKRQDLSDKGFNLLSFMAKHMHRYQADPANDTLPINLAEILELEYAATQKDPFRLEDAEELVKARMAGNLQVRSKREAILPVKASTFQLVFRIRKLVYLIQRANEPKTP